MNWYKRSQQEPAVATSEWWSGNPLDDIEYIETPEQLQAMIQQYGMISDTIAFEGGADPITLLTWGSETYVLDGDPGWYTLESREDWIWGIGDHELHMYIPEPDFNAEFWSSVTPGYILYHGTPEENVESIMQNGLEARNETRGLSNRGTGSAVFLTSEPHITDSYGGVMLGVDMGAMAQDGYTPRVSTEEGLDDNEMRQQLAHKIGLDEFYVDGEQGIEDTTVVVHNDIPAKYIQIVR